MDEDYSSVSGTLSLSDPESPQPMSVSLPFISALPAVDMSVLNACTSTVSTEVRSQVAVAVTGAGPSGIKRKGRPRKSDAVPAGDLKVPQVLKTSSKRGRGRPPGSRNIGHSLASSSDLFNRTARGDFVPHLMTVFKGEDILAKIISFLQKGSRAICVLSANGTVSSVTINQLTSSGGSVTYEGCFEILSLSGSFTLSNKGGMKVRVGGLSVTLAGPDGHVIGGSVVGFLIASAPVQVVVGSFKSNGNFSKGKKKKYHKFLDVGFVDPADVAAANDIAANGIAANGIAANDVAAANDVVVATNDVVIATNDIVVAANNVVTAAANDIDVVAVAVAPILEALDDPYAVIPATPNIFSSPPSPNDLIVHNHMDSEEAAGEFMVQNHMDLGAATP